MDAQTIALVIAGGGALGVVVRVLAKLGKALAGRRDSTVTTSVYRHNLAPLIRR